MNEVDFTSCRRIPGRAYNGANGKKLAVEWRGACWILKFPPSAAERPNNLSYSNSCYSEHVASYVFGMLGDLKDALARIVPRIDLSAISAFVDDVLSDGLDTESETC